MYGKLDILAGVINHISGCGPQRANEKMTHTAWTFTPTPEISDILSRKAMKKVAFPGSVDVFIASSLRNLQQKCHPVLPVHGTVGSRMYTYLLPDHSLKEEFLKTIGDHDKEARIAVMARAAAKAQKAKTEVAGKDPEFLRAVAAQLEKDKPLWESPSNDAVLLYIKQHKWCMRDWIDKESLVSEMNVLAMCARGLCVVEDRRGKDGSNLQPFLGCTSHPSKQFHSASDAVHHFTQAKRGPHLKEETEQPLREWDSDEPAEHSALPSVPSPDNLDEPAPPAEKHSASDSAPKCIKDNLRRNIGRNHSKSNLILFEMVFCVFFEIWILRHAETVPRHISTFRF